MACSLRALCFACLYVLMSTSLAAPLSEAEVPVPLKPWIKWAVADDKQRSCPSLYNSFNAKRCAWPSTLQLRITEQRGDFNAEWRVFADSWIELPGDARHWPQNVTVDGVARAVIERSGKPAVLVGEGNYGFKGEFQWKELPKSLAIPADTGLVDLQVQGQAIEFPSINRADMVRWRKSRCGTG
ncbi:MAG: hypothetical protein O3C28_02860 [Proteobacteria bacterium]|nr:hypothetical protein [Pseudomonadota bacterium]